MFLERIEPARAPAVGSAASENAQDVRDVEREETS
jgi:hypothetical protein